MTEKDLSEYVITFSFLCSLQKCARKGEVDSRELDQRKTLQTLNVVKSTDENDEFEKQRTAAIAEVAKNKEVCKPSSWVCVCVYYLLWERLWLI